MAPVSTGARLAIDPTLVESDVFKCLCILSKAGGTILVSVLARMEPKLEVPFRVHLDCQRPASKVAGTGVLLEGHSEVEIGRAHV